MLFLVQFSVACACLALSDTQQQALFRLGWQNAAPALKARTQDLFNCCGFNVSTQGDVEPDDPFSHPLCNRVRPNNSIQDERDQVKWKLTHLDYVNENQSALYFNGTAFI